MPLAHPISARPTDNYSSPALAITFATSIPGEDVAEFHGRITEVGPWGQSSVGRHRVELVTTIESAKELIELLEDFSGF